MTFTKDARNVALGLVKSAAAAADHLRPRPVGVVILIYHRVGGAAEVELDLPADMFDEQMELVSSSQVATDLDTSLAALACERASERNPVVVTFDDGTADFVDFALPILERHRVPAVLYLATGFVESGAALPYGGKPLSWSALADAVSTGLVTIGSHTHSHAVLDRLDPSEIDAELHRSRDLIEDHLGVVADHFAYPKGVARSREADSAVRRVFRSAATGAVRTNRYEHTDPYRLGRTPIQASDGSRWFTNKAAGGMSLEGTLREGLNRLRYRGRST